MKEQSELVKKALAAVGALPKPTVDDDPVLAPEDWYPHFQDFHHRVVRETPDFDYLWLKQSCPGLYQAIKGKEHQIDELGAARLSEVIAIMREWRGLILQAEFERKRGQASKLSY